MVSHATNSLMRWSILVLQLLVAFASLINIVGFRLDNLLRNGPVDLDRLTLAALAAVVILTSEVLILCRRKAVLTPWRVAIAVPLVLLTALSGFVPRSVDAYARAAEQAARDADQQQRYQAVARELRERADDVEQRASQARPFNPEQAWAFLDFTSSTVYFDEGSGPLSQQALELLRKALASRLIDVNAGVRGHRANDLIARPLFLQFYRERIAPLRNELVRQDWEIMRLLASAGADLTLPDAAPLVADLAKTAIPSPPRVIRLM
jgi:hypothetical protein